MTPFSHQPPRIATAPFAPHDHVRVADGRIGEVIGFYRNEDDAVLVRFESGESRRFARTGLQPLD